MGEVVGLLKSTRTYRFPCQGSVVPDDPEKANGFLLSRFLKQVIRQAGGPFTSSTMQLSQNLKGESWYCNNRKVRRSWRLVLPRIAYDES